VDILYFGGPAAVGDSVGTRGIRRWELLDARQFEGHFRQWLTEIYSLSAEAPRTAEELRSFDEWVLVPHFAGDYNAGKVTSVKRAATLEESFLNLQFLLHQPAYCLISSKYLDHPGLPTSRVPRKRFLPARKLVALLCDNLATWLDGSVGGLTWDGVRGHAITLFAADTHLREFAFFDPWPGPSLLSRSQSAAGVNARPHRSVESAWRISEGELASVLVAVTIPEVNWRHWTERSAPNHPRILTSADYQGWTPDEPAQQLHGAYPLLTREPGSRLALATTALWMAEVMRSRSLYDQVEHWLRQAAIVGSLRAIRRLIDVLLQQGEQLEASYWNNELRDDSFGLGFADIATGSEGIDKLNIYQLAGPAEETLSDIEDLKRATKWAEQNRTEDALSILRRLVEARHPSVSPVASYELGRILLRQGSPEAATHFLRMATCSSSLDIIGRAALGLGIALEQVGRFEEARSAFFRTMFSNDPDIAESGAASLVASYERDRLFGVAVHVAHWLVQHGRREELKEGYRLMLEEALKQAGGSEV
jgi:tetratricopeptide (TPR) repeat protein